MTKTTTAKKATMGIITTGALMAAIAGAVLMFNGSMALGLLLINVTGLSLSIYNIYNRRAAKEDN